MYTVHTVYLSCRYKTWQTARYSAIKYVIFPTRQTAAYSAIKYVIFPTRQTAGYSTGWVGLQRKIS